MMGMNEQILRSAIFHLLCVIGYMQEHEHGLDDFTTDEITNLKMMENELETFMAIMERKENLDNASD